MSRWKRIVVSAGVPLLLLSGATAQWYQSHYVAPFAPPPAQKLPFPNGYDTLQQAMRLLDPVKIDQYPYTNYISARQQFLSANKDSMAKTREALTQGYMMPRVTYTPPVYTGMSHQDMLMRVAQIHAESGNSPEAMQCCLDTMELGIVMPRGGDFTAREAGHLYEVRGRRGAWSLADHIDVATARRAIQRLETMEKRRWPLAESLREHLRLRALTPDINNFKKGPVFVWEKMVLETTGKTDTNPLKEKAETLWNRAKAVYYGPTPAVDSTQALIQTWQERFKQPWQPQQEEQTSQYSYQKFADVFQRTQSLLLRTYLALHVHHLERGNYPESLEDLVAGGYLKSIPVDPFSPTGALLRYNPSGGKLWSVGPDARDNNGQDGNDQNDNGYTGIPRPIRHYSPQKEQDIHALGDLLPQADRCLPKEPVSWTRRVAAFPQKDSQSSIQFRY